MALRLAEAVPEVRQVRRLKRSNRIQVTVTIERRRYDEIFIQCGDNEYPGRQEENKLFVAMMLKYAKQSARMITYKNYPGTHGTFGKNKAKQEDFARFILETSSSVSPER